MEKNIAFLKGGGGLKSFGYEKMDKKTRQNVCILCERKIKEVFICHIYVTA